MRVLFGGTFDPVHHGHLAVARYLRDSGARVSMLVSGRPPFRGAPVVCVTDRMAMLRLALEGEEGIEVSEGRAICESPYTIDVLRRARGCLGDQAPLGWALGSDQFSQLDTWRDWRGLFALTHLIVFHRTGEARTPNKEVSTRLQGRRAELCELFSLPFGRFAEVSEALPRVSSTQVREGLSCGDDVSSLVPEKVLSYIRERSLYDVAGHGLHASGDFEHE